MNEHQRQLREHLESLPYSDVPAPWRLVARSSIGGLTEVGFADDSDDLLVVSSQGRGIFDCLAGERLARDCEEMFYNPDNSGTTAPGIGVHESTTFRLAGLSGGGLSAITHDGWCLYVIQLPWPVHVVFMTSEYHGVTDKAGHVAKIYNDEPFEFRAAGFSPTGLSFVVATSGELSIYHRDAA